MFNCAESTATIKWLNESVHYSLLALFFFFFLFQRSRLKWHFLLFDSKETVLVRIDIIVGNLFHCLNIVKCVNLLIWIILGRVDLFCYLFKNAMQEIIEWFHEPQDISDYQLYQWWTFYLSRRQFMNTKSK